MNETLLLDTDVASFFFKNSAHAKPFRPHIKGKRLALAFVSVVINDGVTRATRIAKLSSGTTVRVEVIDDLPIPVGSFPSIGDLLP
jgi:hypothetical protein